MYTHTYKPLVLVSLAFRLRDSREPYFFGEKFIFPIKSFPNTCSKNKNSINIVKFKH